MNAELVKNRDKCLSMSDEELVAICEFSSQKRSGRGGQKINKTSSAVRLYHELSGISVIASESRYQAENRSIAVKKIKRQMALQIRCPSMGKQILIREQTSLKNPIYPRYIAQILDVLEENSFSVSSSSEKLGISSGRLVKILARDSELWQKVNNERQKFGLNILRK